MGAIMLAWAEDLITSEFHATPVLRVVNKKKLIAR